MAEPLIRMRGITKHFPGVHALDNVDFTLAAGEVHALMGENGAGKSTLVKVLTGAEAFESGEVYLGQSPTPIVNRSPQEAQSRGISTVYQEVNLCPNLSVAENLFAGRQPRRAGFVNWGEMNRRARAITESIGLDVDVQRPLGGYSIAMQQMIAIGRAIDISARVLILDEPTSSLNEQEVAKLFALVRSLRDRGLGIIFITHFLEQVYEVCDTITVLRNGRLVGQYAIATMPRKDLVAAMLGRAFDDLAAVQRRSEEAIDQASQPVIAAAGLGFRHGLSPFDLEIRAGEVVGLAGLLGSGRTEIARAVYGADDPELGTLAVKGHKIGHSPLDSMRAGMAFCPESRKDEGCVQDLSVRENIVLAEQSKRGTFHLIPRAEQEKIARAYVDLLQIKTANLETPIKQLSGGNQQKVILARWLATNPDFLILDEPTRGIDVGTKTEIQKLCVQLAEDGMAVLFISSEIDEMLRTCNRLGIMRDLKKVGELVGDEMSSAAIMSMIAGDEAGEHRSSESAPTAKESDV
ncbi:MAG: sugar ABC transporter ATP-binding protein [Propionibacteriaceae bacterium]|jgi:simple sugar transport system ATP-binding protein|nr:sugar ABC transporter ATP-binding protein [Propionibacteriaceae bacterium]